MSNELVGRLEALKERHKKIEGQKIQAQTECKHLSETRQELIDEMKQKHGVETLDALRDLYETSRKKDEVKLNEFETELTVIEERLKGLQGDQ